MNPTPVIKHCPSCGELFESLPHYNKVYCNAKCRRREKLRREVVRADGKDPSQPIQHDDRYLATLHYPTDEQLNLFTNLVTEDKVVRVIGMNHMWVHPPDIAFVKQPTLENNTDVWIMNKRESSPLDAILNRQL
jgi:hypothetical protein